MGILFVYILKSSFCLAVFYLFYRLLLSRETFHRFNRIALLGILLLSCLLPFVEVSVRRPVEMYQTMMTWEQWLGVGGFCGVMLVGVVDRFGRYGNSCSAGAGECGYVDTGIVAGISVRYSFLHAPQYIFVVWLMGIVEVG